MKFTIYARGEHIQVSGLDELDEVEEFICSYTNIDPDFIQNGPLIDCLDGNMKVGESLYFDIECELCDPSDAQFCIKRTQFSIKRTK
jgi:hypothetical protein